MHHSHMHIQPPSTFSFSPLWSHSSCNWNTTPGIRSHPAARPQLDTPPGWRSPCCAAPRERCIGQTRPTPCSSSTGSRRRMPTNSIGWERSRSRPPYWCISRRPWWPWVSCRLRLRCLTFPGCWVSHPFPFWLVRRTPWVVLMKLKIFSLNCHC